jgi:hypothetical protein
MKQFKGTWKAEIGKDSIIIWECESFGDALEFTIKSEISGIKTIDGKSLIGYDRKNDRLIEAVILKNSPIITLCPSWFNTTNSFEQIMWEDISNPEKAKWKWVIKFKSDDLMELIETRNNEITFIRTFHRERE